MMVMDGAVVIELEVGCEP